MWSRLSVMNCLTDISTGFSSKRVRRFVTRLIRKAEQTIMGSKHFSKRACTCFIIQCYQFVQAFNLSSSRSVVLKCRPSSFAVNVKVDAFPRFGTCCTMLICARLLVGLDLDDSRDANAWNSCVRFLMDIACNRSVNRLIAKPATFYIYADNEIGRKSVLCTTLMWITSDSANRLSVAVFEIWLRPKK